MFFVTGDYSVNFITADQLRIELKAGGLNQQQENHVIGHILQSTQAWEVSALKKNDNDSSTIVLFLYGFLVQLKTCQFVVNTLSFPIGGVGRFLHHVNDARKEEKGKYAEMWLRRP